MKSGEGQILDPLPLSIEERADDKLTAQHSQNLRTLTQIERKRLRLESRKNPTPTEKLQVLKLWFLSEHLICEIIHKVKNETPNGLKSLDENQREKNKFSRILARITSLEIVNDQDKKREFINMIKSEIN